MMSAGMKLRKKCFIQYIRSQDPKVLLQYKTVRNKVRSYIKMVDKRIQNDIAKTSKSNLKAFWKYVKTKTKGRSRLVIYNTIQYYFIEKAVRTQLNKN